MNNTMLKLSAAAVILVGAVFYAFSGRSSDPEKPPGIDPSAWAWHRYYATSLPYSATDGPQEIDRDRALGFTRTPNGALLAAMHLLARVNPDVGYQTYEPTIAEQTTGPGRDALRASISSWNGLATYPHIPPTDETIVRTIGYRPRAYASSDAQFDLVLQRKTETPDLVAIEVRWIDSDWRLVVPAGGDWSQETSKVTPETAVVQLNGGR